MATNLSPSQLQAVKAEINGDAALVSQTDINVILAALKQPASPDFWVWRTNVTRAEIYHTTSVDGTLWSWTIFKNQTVPEQNAWIQMFMGDMANFSLPNLRAGIGVIFAGAASAQNTHCLAIGRRKATRSEKVLSVGTGSTAVPAVMGVEGSLSYEDVEAARAS